mgnify:CR=1 FL=1
MIYRIECLAVDGESLGFHWFPSERAALSELKKRWQDFELEEFDDDKEDDANIVYGGWELYKELNFRSFRTPKDKKALLDFLSTWASYPDNG